MKSDEFGDFTGPFDFDSAFKEAPRELGVYFLRLKDGKMVGRIRGETDSVYVGSSQNLHDRLYQYTHPEPSQWTNKKIYQFVKEFGHDLEFYWRREEDKNKAESEEQNLLNAFEKDRHEKPSLNGAGKRSSKFEAQDSLGLR